METDTETPITEDERKIVQEFNYLHEKSKQLFNGLRDLPQYGHKQWQSYFARTFDVYTKLWKFQQQNRQTLDLRYGLKRWQIGEVASKIGQLYYHYYLRTSETNYLHEAFSFYSAIRARGYFSKVNREKSPELMVKKLRYYARVIVVSLLLRRMELVKELVKELSRNLEEYRSNYNAEDQPEWDLVLGEIEAFIDADETIRVLDEQAVPQIQNHRLTEQIVPSKDPSITSELTLQEAIIVGNCSHQVKFSELTLDMYRMLQTLEREPTLREDNSTKESGQVKRQNPHKYLLYKPSFDQFYTFMSAGIKEIPANSVLLVYLAASACSPGKPDSDGAYDMGGVATNPKKENGENHVKKSTHLKDIHCIHPGDLYPFTRKPLFIVIDSPNAHAFTNMPNLFGQPTICLMSPTQLPVTIQDNVPHKGNLLTHFLHSPLAAFCYACDITDVPTLLWTNCQAMVQKIIEEGHIQIVKSKTIDHVYKQFFSDEFLRLLVTRFIFCYGTLRYHRGFKDDSYYPRCHPSLLGHDILESTLLHKQVLDLASMLDVRALFLEFGEIE